MLEPQAEQAIEGTTAVLAEQGRRLQSLAGQSIAASRVADTMHA